MPVGFNSPARNLFLLGSSGAQTVTNFFKSIDQSSTTDGVFRPDEIRYNYTDQKYILAGRAEDSNSKKFGWFEKRDEAGALDFANRVESTVAGVNTTLRAMELDYNNNLIVSGITGLTPWIAKYSNAGVLEWQSTTNIAGARYQGIASDASGNYYVCGKTVWTGGNKPPDDSFIEKFDSNGNPIWGRSASMLGRDVVLKKISANARGQVVAVGHLEDDSADKGYIVKIDTNTGEVLWDRTLERNISGFGGFALPSSNDDITPADVRCQACYIDSQDQIYVVGSIDGNSPNDNGKGEFLIKYSPEGNIIWQRENNTRDYINNPAGAPNMVPFDVKSDGETEQTVVLSVQNQGAFALNNSDLFVSKYSKNGDLVYRRQISKGGEELGGACLDADPSFYYIMFRDQEVDGLAGTPDRYTFGKVSTSGNGLGAFQYDDGAAPLIDYTIVPNAENKIGRLSDGSVKNDSSDLITYPFTANKLLFDDLATHVSNKKRQMDAADIFEYGGSSAIRPTDFQEMNLLGGVYSGSGDWLDQSGKGNHAEVSDQEPFSGTGAIKLTDAAADFYEVPYSDEFILGTEWTIEFYIKAKTQRSSKLIGTRGDSAPNGWEIVYNFGQIGIEQYGDQTTSGQQRTSEVLPVGTWTHVAVVNYNGGVKIYYDGVDTGFNWTGSSGSTWPAGGSHPLRIGKPTSYNEGPNVLMSNIRIVTGSAIYTSGFNPPSLPLSNTGQTTTTTSGTDYYTGSEWSPGGINNPEDAFTSSISGSGGNGGNFGPFTYTFATPITGVTSARIRGSLGATQSQVGGTTNVIQVDGQDVTQKFKNAGAYAGTPTAVSWVDVTSEVGGTWNSFRVFGQSGSTNPNVSGIEVNGVQLISQTSSTTTTGTVLLTAQGTTMADASDSNHTITANGNAAIGSEFFNATYNSPGGYWEFDGVDDGIKIPRTHLYQTGDEISVEAWINADDINDETYQAFFSIGGVVATDRDRMFQMRVANYSGVGGGVGHIDALYRNSANTAWNIIRTSSPVIANNTWYHVVSTYTYGTGSSWKIYINGVEQSTTYHAGNGNEDPIQPVDPSIYIGLGEDGRPVFNTGSGEEWLGKIGEVRLYHTALKPQQVFQNYNATKSKYINEAPDTAPKIGPGIVYGSNLLLNYDFGNRATYDRVENLYKYSNNFNKTGNALEFWAGSVNSAKQYMGKIGPNGEDVWQFDLIQKSGNSAGEASFQQRFLPSYAAGTVTSQRWLMRSAPGYGTQTVYHKHGRNAVYGANQANVEFDITEEWSEITTTDSVYTGATKEFFGIGTVNADVVVQIASAQLWIGSDNARYVDTYGVRLTAPTTVKNLSSSSHTATFDAEAVGGAPEFNVDGYMAFDSKESIRFGSLNDLGFPTGSQSHTITLECWVKARAGVNVNQIFAGIQSPASQRLYLAAHDNTWEFGWGDYSWVQGYTGGTSGTDAAAVVQDTWTHYCLSINSGVAKLYINSAFTIEKTDTAVDLETGDFPIGGFFEPSETYNTNNSKQNHIGEFRIYNSALSAAEISQNFNATRARYGV